MKRTLHIGRSSSAMRDLIAAVFLSIVAIQSTASQLLPFRALTVRDGLISNSTTVLYQDSKGFLWIGSYDGFSRYDGYTFIGKSASDGLPSNYITAFAENRTRPGTMFIGTNGGGIAEYDTRVRRVLKQGNGVVLSLLEDHRGILWCGTDNQLLRYSPGEDKPIVRLADTGPVSQIRESGDSLLWVMTKRSGLLCLSTAGPEEIPVDIPSIKQFDPILISERSGGVRWMADRNGNFICVRGTSIIRSVISNDPRYHALSLVGVDSVSFWFGTVRGIVHASTAGSGRTEFLSYSQSNGLPEQIVLPVLFDHENNLWMRSFSKGLIMLPDERVLTYRMTPAPMVMNNASVKEDRSGMVWMTSTDGLMEVRSPGRASSEVFNHHPENEKKYGFANALQFDREGTLWVKYWHGFLVQYAVTKRAGSASVLTKLKEFIPGKDLPSGSYSSFLADRSGVVYYSIDEAGLLAFRPNSTRNKGFTVDTVKGVIGKKITVLMEDRDGNIWIGGTQASLSVIRRGASHAEQFPLDTAYRGRTIRSMMQDSLGTIWIGTSFGDILTIDGGKLRTVGHPLLRYNTIWSMSEDRGRIWLGTAKGLMQYDNSTGELSIPSGTISGVAVYSTCVTTSNRVAAVSEEGGHFFEPPLPSAPDVSPRIFITSFTVNGIPIDPSSSIELSPEENTCTIEYIGLTYTEQQSLRYEYSLAPADDGTMHATSHRAVTFASLSPGTYQFAVKALTFRGTEAPASASLSFTILPPVWKRWWFITGTFIVVGMLLASAYRYRVNRLLEVERIRSRIAMDLHDEIGSTLSGISVLSELLKNEKAMLDERSMNMLDRIGVSSRRMMDAMNDIVWALNPHHDSMEEFASKVRMTAGEIFEPRGIAYRISIPDSSGPVLPMDARRQLYLIIKEAIHNIGKHSDCTSAEVAIVFDSRTMHVRISDDGKGFNPNEQETGNGLRNMRRRAAAVNAFLSVDGIAGKGTVITVDYSIT